MFLVGAIVLGERGDYSQGKDVPRGSYLFWGKTFHRIAIVFAVEIIRGDTFLRESYYYQGSYFTQRAIVLGEEIINYSGDFFLGRGKFITGANFLEGAFFPGRHISWGDIFLGEGHSSGEPFYSGEP